MKNIHVVKMFFLLFFMSAFFMACEKDNTPKPGNPVANKLDPDSASGGAVLTLYGSGLGAMKSIVFENGNVSAPFNPNFNTDNNIVFRIPDTANGGPQNIIFTNIDGKSVSVPFKVIALPSVTEVSNYNFVQGTQITLTGNNFDDVSSVVLAGTADAATVVSKTKRTLVIAMPSTAVNRTKLDITNSSGKITTNQEFVNMSNAYIIFNDSYQNGFENASWGPAAISTTVSKSGTASFAATYNKGNWSADGFANWNGVAPMPQYNFLTFWIKGASQDYTLYFTGDQRAAGYGNADQTLPFQIPANVWTYFRVPMTDAKLWQSGNPFKQLGWWIKGPDAQNETFYFDDVMFIK